MPADRRAPEPILAKPRQLGFPVSAHPALFLLSIIALALALMLLIHTWGAPLIDVVGVGTARVFGFFARALWDTRVSGNEIQLLAAQASGSMRIAFGCDGLLGYAIMVAAILPLRSTLPAKLAGLGVGLVFVLLCNQLRLFGLACALLYGDPARFDFYHAFVGQSAMVLAVFLFWNAWAAQVVRNARSSRQSPAAAESGQVGQP